MKDLIRYIINISGVDINLDSTTLVNNELVKFNPILYSDIELGEIIYHYSMNNIEFTDVVGNVLPRVLNDDGSDYNIVEFNYKVNSTNIRNIDPISTIEDWDNYGELLGYDYKYVRNEIKTLVMSITNTLTQWNNLTDDEKYIASKYITVPSSFAEPILGGLYRHHLLNWIERSNESRKKRWEVAKIYVFDELENDAKPILKELDDLGLVHLYFEGIEDKEHDIIDGLFDYVEETVGSSFENNGLKSKVLTPRKASSKSKVLTPRKASSMSEVSVNVMNILRDGIY